MASAPASTSARYSPHPHSARPRQAPPPLLTLAVARDGWRQGLNDTHLNPKWKELLGNALASALPDIGKFRRLGMVPVVNAIWLVY